MEDSCSLRFGMTKGVVRDEKVWLGTKRCGSGRKGWSPMTRLEPRWQERGMTKSKPPPNALIGSATIHSPRERSVSFQTPAGTNHSPAAATHTGRRNVSLKRRMKGLFLETRCWRSDSSCRASRCRLHRVRSIRPRSGEGRYAAGPCCDQACRWRRIVEHQGQEAVAPGLVGDCVQRCRAEDSTGVLEDARTHRGNGERCPRRAGFGVDGADACGASAASATTTAISRWTGPRSKSCGRRLLAAHRSFQ